MIRWEGIYPIDNIFMLKMDISNQFIQFNYIGK